MSGPQSARMARAPYSRLVAHFLRHLEATTSLPLGGRLSRVSHDPAAPASPPSAPLAGGTVTLRATHRRTSTAPTSKTEAEDVDAAPRHLGGSQPRRSDIGSGHPPRSALRASLDSPAGFSETRTDLTGPPVNARSLAALARSYARTSRNALSGAARPEPLRGYLPAPVRPLTARLRAAAAPLDLDRPDPDRPPGPDPLLLDLAHAQLVAAMTHWSRR